MPSSSGDLNAGSRGGGRSVEFFDQINKASIVMLEEGGLVPHPMAASIADGIGQVIAKESASGSPRSADYLDFEPKLMAVVGQDASRLHIGRSRQDIGATIARMSLRDGLLSEYEALVASRKKLLAIAGQHKQTVIPAYTHGVQAQPTTFAHYLLAWESAVARLCERLQQAYQRINNSPLGAAALGTSSFPIDRKRLAVLLGFDGLIENSYDANHIASTDSSLEVASALQISAIQLGQFAQDLHAQYAAPSPWLMLSEGKLTGVSSLMPQKRNPAALEQLRTQCSIMVGDMQTVFLLSHNNRPGMFDSRSYDPVPSTRPLQVYGLFLEVLDGLVVDRDRALAEVNADYATTSGIADALLRTADVPFRIGHHYASTLTNYGRSHGLKLNEIPYAEAARIYEAEAKQDFPLDEAEFKQTISAEQMVFGSRGIGGPQLAEVTRMLADGHSKMKPDLDWLKSRKDRLAAAESALNTAVAALAADARANGSASR
ncbi:argininosuccinate lyase [Afipia sp. GAS231]|uniref:argininosuccinate lyase n=1 Tax=Afipia sp. GAS231 TaxID=1882747 RepID=UPI00087AA390|nr:argininosuccinate lyase [Afipia sp. GAS231]SDM92372.1 argininosuccinate lyase [Afipia sp. GAS231]